MIRASICTIGDEILIGQIVDTNSSYISKALGELGVRTGRMISIADDHDEIVSRLEEELKDHEVVVCTGGLGPTKDDITKDALAELSGSKSMARHAGQEEMVHRILSSRGLDTLEINLRQADVPDSCEVLINRLGTAPIMVFRFPESRFGHPAVLYSMPGVPYETIGALPDVLDDIKKHFNTESIIHRTVMTYGIAESALSELISDWEDGLPECMHLAYLPNQLTGVRLRLSIYGLDAEEAERLISGRIEALKAILGDYLYSDRDNSLEGALGDILRGSGLTVSAAESCTGGEISHLLTSVSGSSEYFLGSVVSYAVPIKEKVLGVSPSTIAEYGIVSSEVASAMAEGVRRLTGSTFSVATTGWAEGDGDEHEKGGTVWVGISGPDGTETARFSYKGDRKRNIERFSASALNLLRIHICKYINSHYISR